jgi:hypothetical protein
MGLGSQKIKDLETRRRVNGGCHNNRWDDWVVKRLMGMSSEAAAE